MPGRHRKPKDEAPQPGVASMAQGQPAAGVEPAEGVPGAVAQHHSDAADALAEGASAEKPEQPDLLVTGGEALEEQQKNPDLKDNTGTRP
jgi:hypothetical protein